MITPPQSSKRPASICASSLRRGTVSWIWKAFGLSTVAMMMRLAGDDPNDSGQISNRGRAGLSISQMSAGSLEERIPDKGLAEEKLNVFDGPISSRKCLEKHHDLLKIHLDKLVGPFDQKRSTDVNVELGEALFFGLEGESVDVCKAHP